MILEPDAGVVEGPRRLERAQALAEILRMPHLFDLGGVGVTPILDIQGGASGGSDRVNEGGNINWRGMGVEVQPSLDINIPNLGDLNVGLGANWHASRVDLPKSLQNLGAPEHDNSGTRGPRLHSLGAGFTPEGSPNSYGVSWRRGGEGLLGAPRAENDKRLMFNFNRKF